MNILLFYFLNMRSKLIYLHVLLLYFICAITFIISKGAVLDLSVVDQFEFLFQRFFWGFFISIIISVVFNMINFDLKIIKKLLIIDIKKNLIFLLASLFFVFGCVFDLIAVGCGNIIYISFLYNLFPFFSYVFEILLKKKKFNWINLFIFIFCLMLAVRGIYIAFFCNDSYSIFSISGSWSGFCLKPYMILTLLSISFSSLSLVLKSFIFNDINQHKTEKNNIFSDLFFSQISDMFVGLIVSLGIYIFFVNKNLIEYKFDFLFNYEITKWAIISAFFSYVVFNVYYMYLLKFISPTFLSLLGSITPFLVSIMAVFFFNEIILWKTFLIGLLYSIFGVVFYQKSIDKKLFLNILISKYLLKDILFSLFNRMILSRY
jgi:drug/metabolite transporter (DMT)-like permease